MKSLGRYFLEGLLFIVPIAVSVYIVYAIFTYIDGFVTIRIPGMDAPVPGVGFVLTIAVITLVGVLTRSFLTRWFFNLFEKLFSNLPIVKLVYGSIKDLIGAFVGDNKRFDKPVLVETQDNGGKTLGFLTKESVEFLGLKDHAAVYFPQSYNFAGSLFIYPTNKITPVDMNSTDVMSFLVSGGVSGGE